MNRKKLKYSEYFNDKLEKYKNKRGRKRITKKLIKDFVEDTKISKALQKNVRRYYQRGDIIDYKNIDPRAQNLLKDAVSFQKTINRQRIKKKEKTSRKRREDKDTRIVRLVDVSSGQSFLFLKSEAVSFVNRLMNDPLFQKDAMFPSSLKVVEKLSAEPPTLKEASQAPREGTSLVRALSKYKPERQVGQVEELPVYKVLLAVRQDGLIDIVIWIFDYMAS